MAISRTSGTITQKHEHRRGLGATCGRVGGYFHADFMLAISHHGLLPRRYPPPPG